MHKAGRTFDVALIGGGVIGLSLAWELAQQGQSVCVTDSREIGHEASWAAAGMLPPGPPEKLWSQCSSLDQLAGLSQRLHAQWHEKLADLTGVDTGYRVSGALYLYKSSPNREAYLEEKLSCWQRLEIEHHLVDAQALADLEPRLSPDRAGFLVPGEAQLRSPWHLQALVTACLKSGVLLEPNCEILGFDQSRGRLTAARAKNHRIVADQFCLTAGCWTGKVAASLDFELPMRPVRGQILLLEGPPGLLLRIVNDGRRYLLPRSDGTILVGSTQEEVGFDRGTTQEARQDILEFAHELCPKLCDYHITHHWAGLRPATPDEQPYLEKLPNLDNAWIAAGHFRAGIQLSTGTAEVMRCLMLGQSSPIDWAELGIKRNPG